MTATDVFIRFLKTQLTTEEYLYFVPILSQKRFKGRAKPILRKGYVEEYLSEHHRTLGGFMGRLFVVCPNLVKQIEMNPTYQRFYPYCKRHTNWYFYHNDIDFEHAVRKWAVSKTIIHYRDRWRIFLKENIGGSSYNAPFTHGKDYYKFELKEK